MRRRRATRTFSLLRARHLRLGYSEQPGHLDKEPCGQVEIALESRLRTIGLLARLLLRWSSRSTMAAVIATLCREILELPSTMATVLATVRRASMELLAQGPPLPPNARRRKAHGAELERAASAGIKRVPRGCQ